MSQQYTPGPHPAGGFGNDLDPGLTAEEVNELRRVVLSYHFEVERMIADYQVLERNNQTLEPHVEPIIRKHPDSPVAKAYLELAKSVAETASKTKGAELPEVQL